MSRNEGLGSALADVPYAGGRDDQVLKVAEETGLPAFSGETRVRAFVIAVVVVAAWITFRLSVFEQARMAQE